MSAPGTSRSTRARGWATWAGPLVTLAALVVVDVAKHGAHLPYPFPETILVATLIVVAGVGFVGGYGAGIVSAALLTLYAFRFYATQDAWLSFSSDTLARLPLLAALAALMAGVSGALHHRELRLRERAVQAEEDKREASERLRRDLAEKNEDLERANRALVAVNDGLESFTYVVSHDLKEPVRAMSALLEDAEEKAVRSDVRTNIRMAREANERLAHLLAGLLEVSRATRVDPSELRPVDILATLNVGACTARFGDVLRERGAILETRALHGTPPALATEEHTCQILGNLVLNAIKHNTKTAPTIRVSVAPQDAEGRMIEVRVEDDGRGFDPRIVNEVGRLTPGRSSAARGGFGLVIVRRAVERLGGKMWVDKSEDLGGASVHFTLPSVVGANEDDTRTDDGTSPGASLEREARTRSA